MRALHALTAPRRLALEPRAAAAGCLAVGALAALALPVAPNFDTWAWLIWGRELLDGGLVTDGGPAWKPLPVLVTAPLALLGDAAAPAWMAVAIAGAAGAALVGARLAARIGGVVAAVLALVFFGLAPWLVVAAGIGNSEGLAALGLLLAVDRHLEGRHGQAFAAGLAGALARPELGPLLALYGLWLVRDERARAPWVAAGLALGAALWVVPELLAGTSLTRSADVTVAEQDGDTAGAADRPALAVVRLAFEMLPAALWAAAAAGAAVLVADRRVRGLALGLAALAAAWLVEAAVLAEAGLAVIDRLLVPVAALVVVLAAGATARVLGALAGRPGAAPRLALAVVAALTAVAAARGLSATAGAGDVLAFHASLTADVERALAAAGGPDLATRCPAVGANEDLRLLVAWELERGTGGVQAVPAPPAVVFRSRTREDGPVQPDAEDLAAVGDWRTLARTRHWQVVADCPAAPLGAGARG